ncbi:right-handed parallel beta-helix repeat-containing protein [Rhodoferax antarcticus]|uniref:right-handed parallel beta-helix repeat-containing protein n=1 Tax=Rhodoferax antarcticus TaxID=81479 RepID=UPI00222488D8|nr:right-handed parallel beta-helix repeat-containing protein [Rhodoferax antarcticus]MCW2313544.1 hypothetical protein [Rhodoferax antarcticus]
MNLLNTLTTAADEEQLRLHPLPDHAIASQNEHLRRHYALLLAAVLTAQPVVSEPQTRLLRLLLDALKLGDMRGQLFDQARELAPELLLEAVRLVREAGFAQHLVVDALVLLRLDAPLNDETARLAGELANFLGLDEAALVMRAMDTSDILGLGATEVAHSQSEAKNTDDDDEDADEGAEQPPTLQPVQLAELWPAQLRQPLTAPALRAGLQGGLWMLDANLDVDFPWQANDAILFFRNGATLNTFAKEGAVKLTGCRLVDTVLDFQGACTITLTRCDWQGNYNPAAKRTALTSNGQALTVTDCQFSTRNARAILVANNALVLTGSRFTRCGHAEMNGGAVCHTDHNRAIENCRFDRCLASYGGAICVNYIYKINKCEFISCESLSLEAEVGIAVYVSTAGNNSIRTSVFRKTSLYVFDVGGSIDEVAPGTQFNKSNVYYNKGTYPTCRFPDSLFSGGRVIKL